MSARIIAVANQKGGVAKTTTSVSLSTGLALQNKKVLLVDLDPQGNATKTLGWREYDEDYEKPSLTSELEYCMTRIMQEPDSHDYRTAILHSTEGIDLIPSGISLSALETMLFNQMNREYVLKRYLQHFEDAYDYIIIDCMPSLGLFTINALTAAHSVLIPVAPNYLSVSGLKQFRSTVEVVKYNTNPNLRVEGILFTIVEKNTINARQAIEAVNDYFSQYPIFKTQIPKSVDFFNNPGAGKSIFAYKPNSTGANAYRQLIEEILTKEEK